MAHSIPASILGCILVFAAGCPSTGNGDSVANRDASADIGSTRTSDADSSTGGTGGRLAGGIDGDSAGGTGGAAGTMGTTVALQGSFRRTGSMTVPRDGHTATLLKDGKVLIAGGEHAGDSVLTSAELYDPVFGTFTATGSLTVMRGRLATATLLPSGKVLIVGGFYFQTLASAELYDPATGTFKTTGSLTTARDGHTATLLGNGKVLVTGGEVGGMTNDSGATTLTILASAELYDPATETFTTTGSMKTARRFHTATSLNNGKVVLTGSDSGDASAELYDPATGTFATTGNLTVSRNALTATLLANGKVLVAGGQPAAGGNYSSSAELYDPSAGLSVATGTMTAERAGHTATLLPSGDVLITGGQALKVLAEFLPSAELYDPEAGTFKATGSLTVPRKYYTATLLSDGRALIVGGNDIVTGESLASAELYQ